MNDDFISRQAAIEALDEYFGRIGKLKRRGLNKGERAISLDVVGVIRMEPSAWIPCSERLPEGDHHVVLICRKNGSVGEGCYHGIIGEWSQFRWNINGIKDVVAWMPLPEPYKEEE